MKTKLVAVWGWKDVSHIESSQYYVIVLIEWNLLLLENMPSFFTSFTAFQMQRLYWGVNKHLTLPIFSDSGAFIEQELFNSTR